MLYFTFIFAIYAAFLSKNYSVDGIYSALAIENSGAEPFGFFNPNHLLYNATGWLFYQGWTLGGWQNGALLPLQLMDALAGAGAATLFLLIMRKVTGSYPASLLSSTLLAFSWVFWFHSTDVETGAFEALFIILCLGLAFKLAKGRPTWPMAGLAGLVGGLAVLFHVHNSMVIPALLLALLINPAPGSLRDKARHLVLCLAILSLVVAGPYLLVTIYVNKLSSIAEFIHWLTVLQRTGSWGGFEPANVVRAGFGLLNSIVYAPVIRIRFLLTGPLTAAEAISWLMLSLAAIPVLWAGIRCFSFWGKFPESWRRMTVLSGVTVISFAAFNVVWTQQDPQFWIGAIIPIFVLAGMGIASLGPLQGKGVPKRALALSTILIFSIFMANFAQWVLPKHNNAMLLQGARYLESITHPNDLLIELEDDFWLPLYARYFARREVSIFLEDYFFTFDHDNEKTFTKFQLAIDNKLNRGQNVYILEKENRFSQEDWQSREEHLNLRQQDFIDFLSQYDLKRKSSFEDWVIWEVGSVTPPQTASGGGS